MGKVGASPTRTHPVTRLLIFDGDCAFCTWAAEWAGRRLPTGAGIEPWQFIDDLPVYGLTVEDVSAAVYWIDAKRRPHRGHLAVAETLRAIGRAWGLMGEVMQVPPVSWIAAGVYEVVARNRHRLPGSTPACKRPRNP